MYTVTKIEQIANDETFKGGDFAKTEIVYKNREAGLFEMLCIVDSMGPFYRQDCELGRIELLSAEPKVNYDTDEETTYLLIIKADQESLRELGKRAL